MAPFLLFLFTILFCSLLCYHFHRNGEGGKGRHPPLPPGPKGLPILGNFHQLSGPKPHRTIHHLSNVYGPLLRLRFGTSDVVIVSSPAIAEQFFRVHDLNFSNRPRTAVGEHLAFNFQDLAFAPYGHRWRSLRKLLALHLFAQKPLNDHSPLRESEASLLVHSLHAHANRGAPADMAQELNVCITNALSRSMFSQRVFGHETTSGEAAEFKEMVAEFMRLSGEFFLSDFVPALRWLDVHGHGVIRRMVRLRRRFELFFEMVIEKHSKGGQEGDLLTVLTRSNLNDASIKALLLDMFTAGTDTSSTAIEWTLSEMIRHPDLLRKAQDEIDSVVGRDRLVCESDLPSLALLEAIVKEAFRLHPPAPLSVGRMGIEACEIDGYHIPKETTMLLNIWALGRDPSTWADPLEFKPGRFLPGGGHEGVDVKGKHFEMLTFGGGRRICVGLSMGMRMVQLLTATLVHAFDWALPGGEAPEKLDMDEIYGLTMHRKVPLVVHPIPRLARQAYETVC